MTRELYPTSIPATLRSCGVAMAGAMNAQEVADFSRHLQSKPVFNAHVEAKSDLEASTPEQAALAGLPMFCHRMADVVCAPHLFEYALGSIEIAKAYFDGEEPLLYSMNAFWTQPSAATYRDTHSWHRDGDDRKQLALFLYGSDVLIREHGAHLYHCRSHLQPDDRDPIEPPRENVMDVLGKAGTMFFADPSGLHMGCRPLVGRRLLAWVRWGVSDPPASYRWDELSPAPKALLGSRYPDSKRLRHAVSLVVE